MIGGDAIVHSVNGTINYKFINKSLIRIIDLKTERKITQYSPKCHRDINFCVPLTFQSLIFILDVVDGAKELDAILVSLELRPMSLCHI